MTSFEDTFILISVLVFAVVFALLAFSGEAAQSVEPAPVHKSSEIDLEDSPRPQAQAGRLTGPSGARQTSGS